MRKTLPAVIALSAAVLATPTWGQSTTEDRLARAREHWRELRVAEAVHEWQTVRELAPDNVVARTALERLQAAFQRTDQYLEIVETLADKGLTAEATTALEQVDLPYATRDQQARLLMVRGKLHMRGRRYRQARVSFTAAETAAASSAVRDRAQLNLAEALLSLPATVALAGALLERLMETTDSPAVAAHANWLRITRTGLAAAEEEAALRTFVRDEDAAAWQAAAHMQLARLLQAATGKPTRDSLRHSLAALGDAQSADTRTAACASLRDAVPGIADEDTLAWLADELARGDPHWEIDTPPLEIAARALELRAKRLTGDAARQAARDFQELAQRLVAEGPTDGRHSRWRTMHGRSHLLEGQILILAGDDFAAIGKLAAVSRLYREMIHSGSGDAGAVLLRIGRMLESRGRPYAAARHYELVSQAHVGSALGAEALWQQMLAYRDALDRPLEAIRILKRYKDLYPPAFRIPPAAEARIAKLGYADTASFQAVHGLKVDGVIGPKTLAKLAAEEANFKELLPAATSVKPVQGKMVQDPLFQIAVGLEKRGRFRDAVHAYAEFLNIYPDNRKADDALLATARIFKRHDLFHEALAAYDRLLQDYPKGDQTSHAYIEAAYCKECLGRWDEAEAGYNLFLKKFPRYRRAAEAGRKLKSLRKLRRYAELVEEPDVSAPNLADAWYEVGRILYKEMDNRQKAAEIFTLVADRYPKTYQAPDARFTAGVCHLHERNFVQARAAFQGVLNEHPKSRLADDAQYWIGFTYEQQAKQLGRLPRGKLALEKRMAIEAARLRGDLALRRRFWPAAADAANGWHRAHPDLLRAGHTREKVRESLHRAVTAYRAVVADHRLGDMAERSLLQVAGIYGDVLTDPARAIEAYEELLEKFPGSSLAVDAQFNVGRHYLEQGDYPQAERAITLFLTSYPNHAKAGDAWLDLAECHRAQKQWLKALDDYQTYLSRYPNSAKVAAIGEEVQWLKKYRF